MKLRPILAAVSAFVTMCISALFSITAWGSVKINNSFSILKNGLADGSSIQSGWKQPVTLQVVTDIPQDKSDLRFRIEVPNAGITCQLQDDSSDLPTKLRWTEALEVAGIEGSSIPGLSISQNGGKPIFTGGSGKYFEVSLPYSSYSYIETHGYAPATSSSSQSGTAGIKAGGEIALTFQIMLNDSAQQNNVLSSRIYVGEQESEQESVTIKYDSKIPEQPVVSQAVLIDGKVDSKIVSNPNVLPYTTNFEKEDPDYLNANEKVYIQASMPLPNPSLMTGNYQKFSLKIWPGPGLTLITSFDVAGIPCSSLPDCSVSGNADSGILAGNNTASHEMITLTSQSVSYIETHGYAPATNDTQARKPAALSPGDDFAITFQVYANGEMSQVFNRAQSSYYGPTSSGLISSFSTLVININQGKTLTIDDTEKESQLQIIDSSGLVTSNTYFPENKWIKMQVLLTMPTTKVLTFPHSLAIMVQVPDGVTLDFNYGSSYFDRQPNIQIAGLTYSTAAYGWSSSYYSPQLQNVPLDEQGNPKPDVKTFTYAIPGVALQNTIESMGLKPATSTSPQGTVPEGIWPGQKFAMTFLVEMNNKAASDNPITVKVGEMPLAMNNSLTANWSNKPYEVTTVLHPVAGADLATLNSAGTLALQPCALPVSSVLPPSSKVANSFRLQLSTTLIEGTSSMEFFIAPSAGVTIDRQIEGGEMEIAGLPVSDLPDPPEVLSVPNVEAPKGDKDPVEIKIDSADLSYIKDHGAAPATAKTSQGKNTGIAYGSSFALVLWGYLNESAVVTPNDVTGWIVSQLSDSQHASDEATVNVMRLSPIKVQTHFIKNGYYETRQESGWGVSTEGTQETLQISITMPTEAEIQAYKRMVIQVEPEKGVTVMSWAPSDSSGNNWNGANWNDIYLAGYNLNVWSNHGILYTIYPGDGNVWMTGGSGQYWNVALGISELNYIQQSGQIAATTTTPPTWASGVKPGEQFSLKLPVYLNSDSAQSGNLVKVSVYWGDNPSNNGSTSVSIFDIVKSAADLPLLLPVTGGLGCRDCICLSLVLLGASLISLLIYKKREND